MDGAGGCDPTDRNWPQFSPSPRHLALPAGCFSSTADSWTRRRESAWPPLQSWGRYPGSGLHFPVHVSARGNLFWLHGIVYLAVSRRDCAEELALLLSCTCAPTGAGCGQVSLRAGYVGNYLVHLSVALIRVDVRPLWCSGSLLRPAWTRLRSVSGLSRRHHTGLFGIWRHFRDVEFVHQEP